MRKYSKALSLVLVTLLAVALVGCGGGTTPEAPRVIKSVDDLQSGDKIGVQSGTTGEDWAKTNLAPKGVEVVPFDDVLAAFNALQAGDVVGVINDIPISKDVAKDPARKLEVVQEIKTNEGYGFGVNKANTSLRDALNYGLQEVVASGEYTEIYKKWFKGVEPATLPTISGVTKPGEIKTLTKGKILVGSDTTYPPFENVENGETVGFDVDLVNAIAAKIGIPAEFKTYKFDALTTGMQTGTEFDMVASAMTSTGKLGDERRVAIDFSAPYFYSDQSLTVSIAE